MAHSDITVTSTTTATTAESHLTARPRLLHQLARIGALVAAAAAGALIMGAASGTITAQPPATLEYRVQVSQQAPSGASAFTTVLLGPGGVPYEDGIAGLRFNDVDVELVVQSRTDAGQWEPLTPYSGAKSAVTSANRGFTP